MFDELGAVDGIAVEFCKVEVAGAADCDLRAAVDALDVNAAAVDGGIGTEGDILQSAVFNDVGEFFRVEGDDNIFKVRGACDGHAVGCTCALEFRCRFVNTSISYNHIGIERQLEDRGVLLARERSLIEPSAGGVACTVTEIDLGCIGIVVTPILVVSNELEVIFIAVEVGEAID